MVTSFNIKDTTSGRIRNQNNLKEINILNFPREGDLQNNSYYKAQEYSNKGRIGLLYLVIWCTFLAPLSMLSPLKNENGGSPTLVRVHEIVPEKYLAQDMTGECGINYYDKHWIKRKWLLLIFILLSNNNRMSQLV